MLGTAIDNHNVRHRLVDFPNLAGLGITATELSLLSRQGSVCKERRGDRIYFKLRFRKGSRQIVRYVGGSESALKVREELSQLRAEKSALREANRVGKIAARVLREAKQKLKPFLLEEGYVFHGLAVRKTRQPESSTN